VSDLSDLGVAKLIISTFGAILKTYVYLIVVFQFQAIKLRAA
jgi:hypothetical protein